MLKFFSAIAVFGLLLTALSAQAQYTPYGKRKTRELLLNLHQNPPLSQVVRVGYPSSPRAEAFLKFYEQKIHPYSLKMSNLIIRYHTIQLLRDSGSYRDVHEKRRWTALREQLDQEYNETIVDEQWTATLREWAHLAEGLKGDLPDFARRSWRDRDLESFPPEFKPMLDEAARLESEYFDAVRETKASADLREFSTTLTETRRRFKMGQISFDEARTTIKDLFSRMGAHVVGHEAVLKKGENLNRMAVLKTQMAKHKGFPTWADYQLAMNGTGYAPEYQGTANQRRFLHDYLSALKPLLENLITSRLKELGLEDRRSDISLQEIGLLAAPGLEMLQPYFPNEEISRMWGQTLLESGFTRQQLSQIVLDDGFRKNKNRTEAYLAGVMAPYNEVERIDAANLNYLPLSLKKEDLKRGLVYILQSYKGSGINDLRTAFHEGGHATEKLLKAKYMPTDESYGYVEVPSLTSEYFTTDPEVLYALAVPVDGQKPSMEEIKKYLENYSKTDLINVALGATGSLFDLELWSIDYTAPGAPTFLEAVKQLDETTTAVVLSLKPYDLPIPTYFSNVSTGHHTSGSVRNIGYDFAGIGAEMMAAFISDELEKRTGRRSWYNQPGFADIYAKKFVSQGWHLPFPRNIEAITGRKFDYMEVVNDFARKLKVDDATCADELSPGKKPT
ncbi:MAG: hypothetical protein KF799_13250 [Bdellovibrionales bacterium]|nr:hypothetical protein [Bdellovibrionales bacterium]